MDSPSSNTNGSSNNNNNSNSNSHHFQPPPPPPVSSSYSPQGPMPSASQPQSLQGSPNSSTVNLSGPGSFSALPPPPPQTAYPATSSSHHHHPHSTFSSLSSQMVNLQVGSMPSSAQGSPVMNSMAPVGSTSATPGSMTPTSSSAAAQHGSLYFNPPSHPGGHYTVSSAYTSTQQQHYSNHQSPSMSASPLPGPKDTKPLMTGAGSANASFYYYGATSPQQQTQSLPPQHQQQQHQQQQQQSSHQQASAGQFQTPQQPLRPQYASLVPPLTDAQYAQYHQLLGSPFSSAPSTPYHSNHSTPYSSMPASPTLEYQQLAGGSATGADGSAMPLQQKPKRRQVKNACVNCQKACKKCDEGRPCQRCIKYGLTDTCVDSTRKVRKKGVKRGPYKRRPPPVQVGSASASTTPVLTHATLPGGPGGPGGPTGPAGYMSEPVSQLNSPTQSHMALPFATSNIGHLPSTLDFYNDSSNTGNYSFQPHRMDSQGGGGGGGGGPGGSQQQQQQSSSQQQSYMPPYTTSYSGQPLYASPYVPNNLPPNMS
ncbi:hypothetical protein DFQ27_001839 [Actinomortierella ambigua]|uniref:Zn(2)-C6 fungal-type domain-containing protein n=1 Tax=Actinomortierella ambigua TaxID=1343610 RepID=A0A9P6QCK0_9FUNG|nr:hypothetical protein DFQ27_001839 [Actinomortierella ambigua]